jgi:RNA polymerase sigma-70 factor, ECF subfamily
MPRCIAGRYLSFCADRASEVLAAEESLSRLAVLDVRQAQVVELRFYGGLTVEEAAVT